jgi:hypothetical protein
LLLAGDWTGLGYIVPGLLAHQLDRQGFFVTFVLLTLAVCLVRVILVAIAWWFSW